jgi:hypothetical protein
MLSTAPACQSLAAVSAGLARQGDVGAAWNSGSFHLNLGFEAEARVGFEAATNLMSAATAIATCEQTVAALQATESLLGCLQAQLQAVRAFLPRDLSAAADPAEAAVAVALRA